MQDHWKNYFLFSVKEQKGVMVLGVLLLLSISISLFLPKPSPIVKKNKLQKDLVLFYFDPNSLDSAHALMLGIPARQITTLFHYRNKGGRFYQKEDLAHWYGLKPDLIEKLIPYVLIQANRSIALAKRNRFNRNNEDGKSNTHFYAKGHLTKMDWTIDINEATFEDWIAQAKLPKKVVESLIQYKHYVGGFYSIYQISKVYGITDSNFQLLRPHLMVKNKRNQPLAANSMTFGQWKTLGIFEDKEILKLLRYKKEHEGKIGWRELIIEFDLTESQAKWIKSKILFNDLGLIK